VRGGLAVGAIRFFTEVIRHPRGQTTLTLKPLDVLNYKQDDSAGGGTMSVVFLGWILLGQSKKMQPSVLLWSFETSCFLGKVSKVDNPSQPTLSHDILRVFLHADFIRVALKKCLHSFLAGQRKIIPWRTTIAQERQPLVSSRGGTGSLKLP